MFLSTVTGEIRKGAKDALDWVVQEDEFGFVCFYNMMTQVVEYEDPRFEFDESDDLNSQRQFVLQELRYALYFCSDYWEQYSKALANQDNKKQELVCLQVCKSLKPKHLSSFLIRVTALYKPTSVVDKPIHKDVETEIEYASFISSKMIELAQRGEEVIVMRKQQKKKLLGVESPG